MGVYSVYAGDPSGIELVLKGDATFNYKDFSQQDKKIDIGGNREAKGNRILLKDYKSEYAFQFKWKILKNGITARPRKGLAFYSLEKQGK